MKTKKRLGQYFLRSAKIVKTIIEAAGLKKDDIVLEIGPGEGVLTRALIEKAGKVVAVEKDKNLYEKLKTSFKDAENLELVIADVRDSLKSTAFFGKLGRNYKVVSNIPYYLTSRLFKLLLEDAPIQPETIVLMVQKEVAERIISKPPKTNILALSIQAYGKTAIAVRVPRRYFKPRPKVDSCVVLVSGISKSFFQKRRLNEKEFFDVVKTGFSQKRKLLFRNFVSGLKAEKNRVLETFKACGINEAVRAENVSLEKWACFTQKL